VSPGPSDLSEGELRELDSAVESALVTGDESRLRVLGYGEISIVLGWPPEQPAFACKRLPPFADRTRFEAHRRTLGDYVGALRAAGVGVVDTELRAVERPAGTVIGYAVQRALPATWFAPAVLSRSDPSRGHEAVERIVEAVVGAIGPRLGLDAQLSNWTWDGSGLGFVDVTMPILWSDEGVLRLDLDVPVQPAPRPLRGAIKNVLAPRLLERFRDLRSACLDLCANLLGEGLGAWLPRFLAEVNARLDRPLSAQEVHRFHRWDARLWTVLLAIRRLDQGWHRALRRPYPYLLPTRAGRRPLPQGDGPDARAGRRAVRGS
jgi:hypothetical protein